MNRDIWQLIQAFNRHRDREMLGRKYAKMRKTAFAFFRGTCHLFYRDLPVDSILNSAPVTWICGDLHLENFGAYKGDNRDIYFGIDDFDEGVLAPISWDIARLLTSIFLAVDSLSFKQSDAQELARIYLTTYTSTLSSGRIEEIVEDNTKGVVTDLLADLHRRKRSEFLDERTELIDGCRRLKIDDKKLLKIGKARCQKVVQSIDTWSKTQANPNFFQVLDVGFRVAGTGSLGLDRYLILVAGKGIAQANAPIPPDRNYLLDFKQQLDSSLQPYLQVEQPEWKNPAIRVMNIQKMVQPSPPALLAAIEFNGSSYLLRELQPSQDKIVLKAGKIGLSEFEKLIETMAKVTAFTHLHGGGKSGATTVENLIEFGQTLDWQKDVLKYAGDYAQQVRRDYQDFCNATQDL